MVDLELKERRNRYIEVFCITVPREKFALEYLFRLEKEGKVEILDRKDYNTPKGHYFVCIEFLTDGQNPVQDLLQSLEDELEEE